MNNEYPYRSITDAGLEAEWRLHLDAADENDDYGGHVGISRYHRAAARSIGDEQRRRREILDANARYLERLP